MFYFKDGVLFCDEVEIDSIVKSTNTSFDNFCIESEEGSKYLIKTQIPSTPIFVYSSDLLRKNVNTYLDAFLKYEINGVLGYALKANGNLELLKLLKSSGVQFCITVSGNEILAALSAGFLPTQIIFNGNGKQDWEISLALSQGVVLNVDSVFDAHRIVKIQNELNLNHRTRVSLRIRPLLSQVHDVSVHPFINTSTSSKFGFSPEEELEEVISKLSQSHNLDIIGIHCHLGSCIYEPHVYKTLVDFVLKISKRIKGGSLEFIDIGGGIGIDYNKKILGAPEFSVKENLKEVPSVDEFLGNLKNMFPDGIKVIFEPGRSLVGNAGILVSSVLGIKRAEEKLYLVVDAAMTELIRPCLYNATHQICPTKVIKNLEWVKCDVVGPVCESGDFLGKSIMMQICEDLEISSKYVAVMDAGAYGFSMSSNYNMRSKVAEILVDKNEWKCIRKRETFQDIIKNNTF